MLYTLRAFGKPFEGLDPVAFEHITNATSLIV
jgi:hypothetical protein